MPVKMKRYTLKDFHAEAASNIGVLPHVERIHVESGWWYGRNDGYDRDTCFQVVVYTDFCSETGHDTKNIRGEGQTPQLAIEHALYSYQRAFEEDVSAGIAI